MKRLLCALVVLGGCGNSPTGNDAAVPDLATMNDLTSGPPDLSAKPSVDFCQLPGSIVYSANGQQKIPGGPAFDISWIQAPNGFCVHWFANVPDARQLRFAPGGELFVSSPTTPTTGGGPNGLAAIVLLPDDDGDGVADRTIHFLDKLPSTQGLLFANDSLYYQDGTTIRRLSYQSGQRGASGPGAVVVDVTVYQSFGHWPKTLDVADDGTIYVGNGGDQYETCDQTRPFHGGILKLDGSPGGGQVVKGLRNPIAVRCQRGRGNCFTAELALDYSAGAGGREKLIPIHAGDDWGFPCCATKNLPYMGVQPVPDCSNIQSESNAFVIGETPFGIEFDYGAFPAPWTSRIFVALHGEYGTWRGARLVAISTDPMTGLPLPSSDLNGGPSGAMDDFATGWDTGKNDHGRPAALTMSPDGRLFLANDVDGTIVWFAPVRAGG